MSFEVPLSPGHADRLTVLEVNSDSSKLLTASVDHRVAVYDINKLTGKRKQLDVFTAHDAEIRDAKWFHASTGTHFVTIGHDLQMRIWTQDIYQAPMSGRRFRRIGNIKCEQFVPFVSVDVKTVGSNTYIVVIDRQGLLSLYEPSTPDEFNDWSLVDRFNVYSPVPGRADHTSFRVKFDPNAFPLPYLSSLSDDSEQLSIAVTTMNEIKLFRTSADTDIISTYVSTLQQTPVGRAASHRLFCFETLRVSPFIAQPQTSSGSLLRDIAFSPANYRGTDILAIASINGTVAIYEISLRSETSHQDAATSQSSTIQSPGQSRIPPPHASHQSNLTSALNSTASSKTNQPSHSRADHPFPYAHHATPITILQHAHLDAWSVKWDPAGQTLLSSGIDGTVKMWKRSVGTNGYGDFELFAEQAGEEDESDGASAAEEEEREEEDENGEGGGGADQ